MIELELPHQFTSKNPGYQFVVKQPVVDRSMGYERVERPIIVADFGEQAIAVETYAGVEGEQPFQQIRGGGFFDSQEAQRQHGWTDDERELCERRLLELCPGHNQEADANPRLRPPGYGDIHVYELPKAEPPWPTYDDVHHEKVAQLASELGLVGAAFNYESRTKRRKSVMAKLEEKLELEKAEEQLSAA